MQSGSALILLAGAFAGSAAVTWAAVPFVIRLAGWLGWLDQPGGRHTHQAPVPRVGGIALILGLLAGSVLYGAVFGWDSLAGILSKQELVAFFGPACLVFLIGLLDDIRGLSPSPRLLVEAIAAAMAIQAGYRIDVVATPWGDPVNLGLLTFPVTLLWFVGVTNAFNLIDGLDGLLATVGLVTLLGCAAVGLHGGMLGTPALALAMAGALMGILPWNWAPARIFLGDSGALLVGFTAAAWSIKVSRNVPAGTLAFHVPLMLCFLPLAETALTLSRRWLSGVPFFVGDRSHIHHVLLSKGLGVRSAVASLGAVAALFAAAAYLSRSWRHEGPQMALALILLGAALGGLRYLGYVEVRVLFDRVRELLRPRRRLISGIVRVARAGEGLSGANDLDELATRLQRAVEAAGFQFVALRWSEEASGLFSPQLLRRGERPESRAWLAGQPEGSITWVFVPGEQDAPAPAATASVCWSLPIPRESGRYGLLVVYRTVDVDMPGPSEADLLRYLAEPLTLALMALEARRTRALAS